MSLPPGVADLESIVGELRGVQGHARHHGARANDGDRFTAGFRGSGSCRLQLTVESKPKHHHDVERDDLDHRATDYDDDRGSDDHHNGRGQRPAVYECGDHGGHPPELA